MSSNTIMIGVGVVAMLLGAGALIGLFGRGRPGSPVRVALRIAGMMALALGLLLVGFAFLYARGG